MVSLRPSYKAWLDEYYCVSTDEKPVGVNIKNGSSLKEMDTGKKYMFDAEHQRWIEVTGILAGGGSSSVGSSDGGSSGSTTPDSGTNGAGNNGGIFIVNVTAEPIVQEDVHLVTQHTVTSCDATFNDIAEAIDTGSQVLVYVAFREDTEDSYSISIIPIIGFYKSNDECLDITGNVTIPTNDSNFASTFIEFSKDSPLPDMWTVYHSVGTQNTDPKY